MHAWPRVFQLLTIQNFILHPDRGTKQHTDADIIGVRFPDRNELFVDPMKDDELFIQIPDVPYTLIAEVNQGRCDLNGSWTDPTLHNVTRVLRAIGIVPLDNIDFVSKEIYNHGFYHDGSNHITLFCMGDQINEDLVIKYPRVPQVLWDQALRFIFKRFRDYRSQKGKHKQWDESGHILWRCAAFSSSEEDFVKNVKNLWKVLQT